MDILFSVLFVLALVAVGFHFAISTPHPEGVARSYLEAGRYYARTVRINDGTAIQKALKNLVWLEQQYCQVGFKPLPLSDFLECGEGAPPNLHQRLEKDEVCTLYALEAQRGQTSSINAH